jgi:hypothetical protein
MELIFVVVELEEDHKAKQNNTHWRREVGIKMVLENVKLRDLATDTATEK